MATRKRHKYRLSIHRNSQPILSDLLFQFPQRTRLIDNFKLDFIFICSGRSGVLLLRLRRDPYLCATCVERDCPDAYGGLGDEDCPDEGEVGCVDSLGLDTLFEERRREGAKTWNIAAL